MRRVNTYSIPCIVLSKMSVQVNMFLILPNIVCLGTSLEEPWLCTSDEHPQYILFGEKYLSFFFWFEKKTAYVELWQTV